MELSPEKKNDGNFASRATRNDAVSRHFFLGGSNWYSITNENIKFIP
jgi:hypothetical protein